MCCMCLLQPDPVPIFSDKSLTIILAQACSMIPCTSHAHILQGHLNLLCLATSHQDYAVGEYTARLERFLHHTTSAVIYTGIM